MLPKSHIVCFNECRVFSVYDDEVFFQSVLLLFCQRRSDRRLHWVPAWISYFNTPQLSLKGAKSDGFVLQIADKRILFKRKAILFHF